MPTLRTRRGASPLICQKTKYEQVIVFLYKSFRQCKVILTVLIVTGQVFTVSLLFESGTVLFHFLNNRA